MNLVEQTCRVRVAQTQDGGVACYWVSAEFVSEETMFKNSVICGKPASNYVELGEDRVWAVGSTIS